MSRPVHAGPVAGLPMYDWPEVHGAVDALWAAIGGRLREAEVDCSEVMNHDDSEWGVARDAHDGVFVRSVYFRDPDGILLEFAAWTRGLGPDDVSHDPAVAGSG